MRQAHGLIYTVALTLGLALTQPMLAHAEATLPTLPIRPTKEHLLKACNALLTNMAPAKPTMQSMAARQRLNLLFAPNNVDALNVRWVNGLNKKSYGLIDEMSDFGFKGLVRFLQTSDVPTSTLVDQMVRLGLLDASGGDELYAKMWLLAENKDVRLSEYSDNPAIAEFLRPFQERFVSGEIDEIIQRVNNNTERTARLLELFAKALERLDQADKESVLNLDQAFMEVNRLRVEGRLTAESFEQTMQALSGEAKFTMVDLQAPGWLSATIGALIPGSGLIVSYWNTLSNKGVVFTNERIDVSQAPSWKKKIPNTLLIKFKKSDVLNLQANVTAFIEKYLKKENSTWSLQFAQDFFAVYPETQQFRGWNTNFEMQGNKDARTEPFGPVSEDQRRILSETAFFLSLIKGDARPFARLTKREFSELRSKMLNELGFLDDQVVSSEEIDFFITFAVVEFLGRSQNAVMDSLAAEFHVAEKLNDFDYERRASHLLRRFAFLSYSFARQKPVDQSVILGLQDGAFMLNMEHILRLVSSKRSFKALRELDRRRMSFLFFRNLFFFAASSPDHSGYSTALNSQELNRWLGLKRILDRASDDNASSDQLYDEYVQWVASGLGLDLNSQGHNSAKEFMLIKLATISIMSTSQMKVLERQFDNLSSDEQNILLKYLVQLPTLVVNGTGFYFTFRESAPKHGYTYSQAVGYWLKSLAKMFSEVDRTPFWHKLNPHTLRGDIRFFVEPLADAIEKYGPEKAINYTRMSIHPKQKTITFGVKKI